MNTTCIRRLIYVLLLVSFLPVKYVQSQSSKGKSKRHLRALQYIDERTPELKLLSDSIWNLAEPSFGEIKSSRMLMEFFRKEGFRIQENVSGFPTVFIATYGENKPIIGLFGEYDADPGASNLVVPRKAEIATRPYGHGGGHNLLGVGSVGAALAMRDLIAHKKLTCTIRFYGTTAEGGLGSKTYLARDGYFNDLDLSLYWHPAPVTVASTAPWDALIDLKISMNARKVNVMLEKESTPNTTAALELLMIELHSLRSMTNQSIKFNYDVSESIHSLSETPDTIRVTVRIQCARQTDATQLFEKIGAAVKRVNDQSNVRTIINVARAMHQYLPNVKAMEKVYQNLLWLGPIQYSSEEIQFVKDLQQQLGLGADGLQDKIIPFSDQSHREQLYGYASDIGDASWISPEVYFVVTSLPGVPMHKWPGTIFTGHSIGHKGMIQASKALALTIIDYVENSELQKNVRKDFEQRREHYRYHSFLSDGPPDTTKSVYNR